MFKSNTERQAQVDTAGNCGVNGMQGRQAFELKLYMRSTFTYLLFQNLVLSLLLEIEVRCVADFLDAQQHFYLIKRLDEKVFGAHAQSELFGQ